MHEHHSLDIVFSGSPYGPEVFLRCDAPEEALCHAVYRCRCAEWFDEEVIAGVPRHKDSDEITHVGHFQATCKLDDWFLGSDYPEGSVNVPLEIEWADGYIFHIKENK